MPDNNTGDTSENTKRETAPYVPWSTFETGLNHLKTHGLPHNVDSSLFPSMSGTIVNQFLASLRFLGLIDTAGDVQPDLEKLVDTESRTATLGRLLRDKYSDLIAIGLEKASPSQFDEALRLYNVQGEAHRKAKSFFLKAASEVKLPLSSHLTKKTRTGAGRKRSTKKANSQRQPQHQRGTSSGGHTFKAAVGESGEAEFRVLYDPFEIPPEQ